MRTNIQLLLKTQAYYYLTENAEAIARIERKIERHDTKRDNAQIREIKRREKDEK